MSIAEPPPGADTGRESLLSRAIRWCLENRLVTLLGALVLAGAGLSYAPFDWDMPWLPRDPVAVDAIPDIGENQQIVFTRWPGRSPRDVEDQITYPLTTSLLGLPGVKTVRANSMFGFSSVAVIFEDTVEFYWSRSRVLEKLASLPPNTLPDDAQPVLGPDATALGQVFWYTLEGRDPKGRPTGGWDLEELRREQDWKLRYELGAVPGVAEVASIGGFSNEYQIDVDPDKLRIAGVTLEQVVMAVKNANIDVGARTMEINRVEHVIRGLGFVKTLADIEKIVLDSRDHVAITIADVAQVVRGPMPRRGVLDKDGVEAVGGVVVVRYGANPLEVIERLHRKIALVAPALAEKTLEDGTRSRITVVPFYDRTELIHETLNTLTEALTDEVLVTVIVVLALVMHLAGSSLIALLLPIAVLWTFVAMKTFGIDANIVALSGIAIAIGTMVDMGIVVMENIIRHFDEAPPGRGRIAVITEACREVAGAVLTAVSTTVIGFLPVFFLEGAEGKLFKPLAYTKTFALVASILTALFVLPVLASFVIGPRTGTKRLRRALALGGLLCAVAMALWLSWVLGAVLFIFAAGELAQQREDPRRRRLARALVTLSLIVVFVVLLAMHWLPLGPGAGETRNVSMTALIVGGLLGLIFAFQRAYLPILRWCLRHKALFLCAPLFIVLLGVYVWLGPRLLLGEKPQALRVLKQQDYEAFVSAEAAKPEEERYGYLDWMLAHDWDGRGQEFMPALDEGAFLFMPTTMPHAGIEETQESLAIQDRAIRAIPEVRSVVGKIGRVESPLDPAPLSMVETLISYHPEYHHADDGSIALFAVDDQGAFVRDEKGLPVPDPDGKPFRIWRDHIRSPTDIWKEIVHTTELPGTTSAPKLQPIETRLVMLQSGMRAPMGVKIFGDDLKTIEAVGLQLETVLKQVPAVESSAVVPDRIIAKSYIEIEWDRDALKRYGIPLLRAQRVIEVALGGMPLSTTIQGRERYPLRVRYQRPWRESLEALGGILVSGQGGVQVPLEQLAAIEMRPGPQVLKSENGRLVGYVLFDKREGYSEVETVEQAQIALDQAERRFRDGVAGAKDAPTLDRKGCGIIFAGSYEQQVRSAKRFAVLIPLALGLILLILYLQFRRGFTTILVFSGVFVAFAGGFLMLWLYSQPWFLDFSLFGENLRDLFHVRPYHLSVAVWVGFLALFGIATDDGVVMATYLDQRFAKNAPHSVREVRDATAQAGARRVRPCLMTTATTVLALLPVLTSTGRGSDVMIPMAIPSFGGMCVELLTMFVVPVLYCWFEEFKLRWGLGTRALPASVDESTGQPRHQDEPGEPRL